MRFREKAPTSLNQRTTPSDCSRGCRHAHLHQVYRTNRGLCNQAAPPPRAAGRPGLGTPGPAGSTQACRGLALTGDTPRLASLLNIGCCGLPGRARLVPLSEGLLLSPASQDTTQRLWGLPRARVTSSCVCLPHSGGVSSLFLGSMKSTLPFRSWYKCHPLPRCGHQGHFDHSTLEHMEGWP